MSGKEKRSYGNRMTAQSAVSAESKFLSLRLSRVPFFLLFLPLSLTNSHAAGDEKIAVIKKLGSLNGTALHCNALDQTQRMKKALVLNLPKIRQLGELFDYETNASFVRFINEKATCPSEQTLADQVDKAIKEMEAVYAEN